MMTQWQVIALLGIFALSILLAVMVGAYAVFRTKRESHEGFLSPKVSKGEVFSIDDLGADVAPDGPQKLPASVKERSDAFLDQVADNLTDDGK